ncbi:hypothetical protein [Nocardia asteroides]|uniref:hypothetical protein n=1 Tax=Nocardia asteroides TaxID=1824 RepID=UPI003411A623
MTAFVSAGCAEILCLTTADLGFGEAGQACSATPDRVADWWAAYRPFDVALVAPDLSALVLLSVDEFVLVGGSSRFVESALGTTVDAGRAAFSAYAADMAAASRHLPGVAQRWCRV